MPKWVPLDSLKAIVEAAPGAERLSQEAGAAARELLRIKPRAADPNADGLEIVRQAVSRGELPQGIYPNAYRFQGLRDPRMVTVESKTFSENALTIVKEPGRTQRSAVHMDGQRIGLFDSMGGIEGREFPFKLRTVNLELSNGTKVEIPQRSVQVIKEWKQEGGRWSPSKESIGVPQAVVSPLTTLSFDSATQLKPGAQLIDSFPFQQYRGKLTNGQFDLSLDRTADAHWRQLNPQFDRLPEGQYQELLKSLDGKHLDEAKLPEWATLKNGRTFELSKDVLITDRPRFATTTKYESFNPSPDAGTYSWNRRPPYGFAENGQGQVRSFTDQLANPVRNLKDGKEATVESAATTENRLTLRPEHNGEHIDEALYINDQRVGLYDSKAGTERFEFPATVKTTAIKLSDGTELAVSDRNVYALKEWGQPNAQGVYNPETTQVLSTGGKITPWHNINQAEAATLQAGTKVVREYPFQDVNGVLTNGSIELPLSRAQHQFAGVPQERYDELQAALKGKTLGEAQLPSWATLEDGRIKVAKDVMINPRPIYEMPDKITTPLSLSRSDFAQALNASKIPAVLREHGGETVRIQSVTLSQHQAALKLEPKQGEWLDQGVHLNGQRIGVYQDWWHGMKRHEFPTVINTAEVKLSDGRVLAVSDQNLRVVKDWNEATMQDGRFTPNIEQVFSKTPIRIGPWDHFTYEQAKALQPGDEFVKRFPFLWDGDILTNGVHSLPRVRPQGQEWRRWPIPSVKEGYWEPYTNSLENKYVDNLVKEHPKVLNAAREAVDNPAVVRRILTPAEEQVQGVLSKVMWDGKLATTGEKADYVDIGKSLIFKLPVAEGKLMYIVDNPGDGAIYLFDNAKHAEQLASGYMGRMYARDLGVPFVIHQGEWQETLAKEVADLRAKMLAA